jgi:hypothetical protein
MDDDTPPSITDLAHERGDDGDPLPVKRTAKVRRAEEPSDEGENEDRGGILVTIKVYPATSGQRNTWQQRLEEEGKELTQETEAELFDEFAAHKPADFNDADAWADVRPAISDALGEVILAELFDVPQDQFFEALNDWSATVASEGN